jgi:hypothetical protein
MLMHVSLTASLIILRPAATGMALVVYELAWAGSLWAIMATIAVQGRRRPSLHRLHDREAISTSG